MRKVRLTLRGRLLVSAVLPAVLMVAILELVFISHYERQLDRSFEQRGLAIAQQIGAAAEYALFSDSTATLRMLADGTRQQDSAILSVSVLDRAGKVLARSGEPPARHLPLAATAQISSDAHRTAVQTPIFQSAVQLDGNAIDAWHAAQHIAPPAQIGYVLVEISREELAQRKREMLQITLAIVLGGLLLAVWLSLRIADGALLRLDATHETLLRQMEAAETLARTDTLTGLANRRAFDEAVAQEVQRALRYHTPLALIMTDIDHFKAINDSYGHHVGDHVLRHFASVLTASVRNVDLVGRWGGEEFAILLPGTELEEAVQAAERMRLAVGQALPQIEGNDCAYTASFGVAALRAEAPTVTSLFGRADAALYRAKAKGRNRVERG